MLLDKNRVKDGIYLSPESFRKQNQGNWKPLSFLETFIALIHCTQTYISSNGTRDSFFTVKTGKQSAFLLSTEPCCFF